MDREVENQRRYYQATAESYNQMHVDNNDGHFFALSLLPGFIDHLEIESILDIGSGTGRAVKYIYQKFPNIRIMGIEPIAELREIAYSSGIPESALLNGD